MAAKNILFFTYWYPNANQAAYALFVKRHAQALALNQNLKVLAVNVVKGKAFFKSYSTIHTDECGLETHLLYLESRYNKLLYLLLPLHVIFIKKHINRNIFPFFKFQHIHANILFPCAVMARKLAKHYNCSYLITEHWSKINKFFKVSAYKYAGQKALNEAAAITCVSAQLLKTVQQYTNNKHLYIVPNVVDARNYQYNPGITKNSVFTFIAIAHWHAPKHPAYFLQALKLLATKTKLPFRLQLIGLGPLLDEIKKEYWPFEIDYSGNLSAQQINLALNKSHAFLHGSDYETFSVVIAEALTCGLPCVVSPVGIASEVINANNGFVTNNTSADWALKVEQCFNGTYNYQSIAEGIKNNYTDASISVLFDEIYLAI